MPEPIEGSNLIVHCMICADNTPPLVRLTSHPPPVTRETTWSFSFECYNEISGCTYYECSLQLAVNPPVYYECGGSNNFPLIQVGPVYEYAVRATDRVGNVGPPTTYQWRAGELLNDVMYM